VNMKIALSLIAFLAIAGTCTAQSTKPGGGGASGSGNSGGTSTPSTSAPKPSSQPVDPSTIMNRESERMKQMARSGDLLTGNVDITGGASPWDPIVVSVLCDGKTSYTTNTDAKGQFAIVSTDNRGPNTVKADPKPVAGRFVGCNVEAALPGFNSSSLPIGTRNVLDSPGLGTVHLTREQNSGGSAVSSTTASAPKDAAKSFEKARAAYLENKPDKAEKELQKAVQTYPQFAEAWYQLGRLQEAKNPTDAYNSYSKAAAADPKFVPPYEHMAIIAGATQKWQDVVDATKKSLELDPRGDIQVWYYNALGNLQLKNVDEAQKSATKSLAMDPLHQQPNTEQLLAVILANKQDYAGALEHLKNCLTYFPPGPNLDLVKQQIAQIEPVVKKPG
jgi:tetratricopeptide (TPR) repeat protein